MGQLPPLLRIISSCKTIMLSASCVDLAEPNTDAIDNFSLADSFLF